ncbi:MAG: NAD(P)/FAD-dependent oxidoreductase [Bacteroidia bacterium]
MGVTLNNDYVRAEKAKFAGSDNWVKDFYLQELSFAPHLSDILRGAHMEHEVLSIGDYSYYVENKFGKNYAMIGDAGAFLDPIFSSGIYVAFETASRVCKGVHTTLTNGFEEGKKVFEKEFEQINGGYKLIEKFVRLFYTPELLNFAKVNPSHVESYETSLQAYNIFHYLLAGDFFENHKLYNEFLDSINSEKSYNRFIKFVQERSNETDLNQDCGYTFEDIYGHLPMQAQVAEVKP